jgi:hypothetical protein
MYILQCTCTWVNEPQICRFCCKMATMTLLPAELGASLCEKAQGMVESPQLYFEVPEIILEFIYSAHEGTLTSFLRNCSHNAPNA